MRPYKYEPPELTELEKETLRLLAKGLSNEQIGDARGVKVPTVRSQLEKIYTKMDVSNRVEAVVESIRQGVVVVEVER